MTCRWHDENYWKALYGTDEEGRCAYLTRDVGRMYETRASGILNVLAVHTDFTTPSILVAGAGLGHTVAALRSLGVDCAGIENSTFIWDNMETYGYPDCVSRADFLDDTAFYDVVVTDDVIMSFEDDELPGVYAALERLGSRVLHYLSVYLPRRRWGDSSFNHKTLDQWRETAPHHIWYGR